jgi:hypothetical protein
VKDKKVNIADTYSYVTQQTRPLFAYHAIASGMAKTEEP